ncbi:MAG: class I SAM-dependent methyltransferase [Bacteroidota bacterium]|nr:class I SAM-dependent methyltransferase [Bacteroidota bacterium]
MYNKESWKPSKFQKDANSGGYIPNPSYVGVGSRYVCQLYINDYVKLIQEHCSGYLLDCGCGDVPYYEIYRDKISDVYCIDWENSLHKNPYVDQCVDLNNPFPLESNSFDTVLAADVLEHIYNPMLFMNEVARVVKPGGKVLIMVPYYYWVHEAPHDYYRYTEYALKKFCDVNKLNVVYLQPYGGYPDILLDLFNKKYVTKETGVRRFLKFSRWLQSTKYYKNLCQSTERQFPLGYCLVAQKP